MTELTNIKQFKLSNGEEVICEVVEWSDEEHSDLVIRRALKLNVYDDDTKGVRYYHFKPWMMMQEGDEMFMTLNINHIISEANPTAKVIANYMEAVKNANLTEEEIAAKIEEHIAKMRAQVEEISYAHEDSDYANILMFPRGAPKKLH